METDDRATRQAVLRPMAEEKQRRHHHDSQCLRGKQCPIQRPIDRWVE